MDEEKSNTNQAMVALPRPERDAQSGKFLPGHGALNVGRGLGGRSKALRTLDAMLATEGNQQRLKDALQEYFNKNPIRFFRTIIMPLLPKETRLEMASEGRVLWTRISEAYPPAPEEGETIDVPSVQL